MEITKEALMGTFEERRAMVSQFNLMDDTFFSVVMEDKAACEYLLSELLGKKIRVIENKTQYSIRNIENHSIILDALVEDENHDLFDVEVQSDSERRYHERRLRYYRTAIDWSYLEKGAGYKELPELYMIFISDFDPFGLNENHYEIKQYVGDAVMPYDDGVHRLYFNTVVEDGTRLSDLLQYLKHSDADNNNFGALSRAVNHHKIIKEGVDTMCKAVEEYAAKQRAEGEIKGKLEKAVETVRNMLKKNIPLETALECAEIDRQTYENYVEALQ